MGLCYMYNIMCVYITHNGCDNISQTLYYIRCDIIIIYIIPYDVRCEGVNNALVETSERRHERCENGEGKKK